MFLGCSTCAKTPLHLYVHCPRCINMSNYIDSLQGCTHWQHPAQCRLSHLFTNPIKSPAVPGDTALVLLKCPAITNSRSQSRLYPTPLSLKGSSTSGNFSTESARPGICFAASDSRTSCKRKSGRSSLLTLPASRAETWPGPGERGGVETRALVDDIDRHHGVDPTPVSRQKGRREPPSLPLPAGLLPSADRRRAPWRRESDGKPGLRRPTLFMLSTPLLATTHPSFINRRTQATSNAGFCPEFYLPTIDVLPRPRSLPGTTFAAPASAPWQHLAGPPVLNPST